MLVLAVLQRPLLWGAFRLFRLFVKKEEDLWVVGTDEIANNIFYISSAFDNSYTVNLSYNKFYAKNNYNFSLGISSPYKSFIVRYFVGPVLLGYLANKASGFFYIWKTGFLIDAPDGRKYEFQFLKEEDVQIATFFCGTDIRSLRLSIEHAKDFDLETIATYQAMQKPELLSDRYENILKNIASSADLYADYIWNAPVDQISYIKRDVYPFLYFYPDNQFVRNDEKFRNLEVIKIVHAPSSPFIKGTPIIRATVKNLKLMGYNFDYVEVINSENNVVLNHLKTAHIVINELYAFMPGLFSVEALASHCALITSANRTMEPTLAVGADEAWYVTGYWQIFDHLKDLLDNPDLIKTYADKGFDWAYTNCRLSHSRQILRNCMKE